MKLSIIIPTLNEEKYLPGLLSEIKKQTFKDWEIIVADAGSEDKTVEIAKNFGCKIVSGGLPTRAKNEGAKAAEGDLFLFMDADNVYLPKKFLQTAVEEFIKRNLGIAAFPIFAKGNKLDRLAYGLYNVWVRLTQKFLPHTSNTILVKKEVHGKIFGFDEKIKIGEDHHYARQASKISPFGFIKTAPILTSARRLEADGRFRTYFKYLLVEILMFFGPIKSDIFKYKFGHYKNE